MDEEVWAGVSLITGCPLSVAMLVGHMLVFAMRIQRMKCGVRGGVFIHDRVMWARGDGCAVRLLLAIKEAKVHDTEAGARWNTAKDGVFMTGDVGEEAANEVVRLIGKPTKVFVQLGIEYDIEAIAKDGLVAVRKRAKERAAEEMKRIQVAAPRSRKTRRRMLRRHIMPKLAWGGQWQALPSAEYGKLRKDIERCLRNSRGSNCCGKHIGRSPALAWVADFGPALDPEYLADETAIRAVRALIRQKLKRQIKEEETGVSRSGVTVGTLDAPANCPELYIYIW